MPSLALTERKCLPDCAACYLSDSSLLPAIEEALINYFQPELNGKKVDGEMTHYFHEPNSFRLVDCKSVPGERAQKACREWNALIRKRNKLRQAGKLEEARELERMMEQTMLGGKCL